MSESFDRHIDALLARSLAAPPMRVEARARILTRLERATRPRVRSRRVLFIGLGAAALAAVLAIGLLRPEPVGRITATEGTVEIEREAHVLAGSVGMRLRDADVVRVTAGRARVRVVDRADLDLTAPATLRLSAPGVDVQLERGRARASVERGERAFRMQTPVGSLAVARGRYSVSITGVPPLAFVSVDDGTLEIDGAHGAQSLGPGQTATLSSARLPSLGSDATRSALRAAPSPLPDCRHGGPGCDEVADVVGALRAMEMQVSEAEAAALADAIREIEGKSLPAWWRLHRDVLGVEAPSTSDIEALSGAIGATLTRKQLDTASPGDGTPAGRLRALVAKQDLDLRAALAARVPRERVDALVTYHQNQRNKGHRATKTGEDR